MKKLWEKLPKKAKRIGTAVVAVLAIAAVAIGTLAITGAFKKPVTTTDTRARVNVRKILETFEISALDYEYTSTIIEKNVTERKLAFIPLKDAVQMYIVLFDGSVKIGINGKDIQAAEKEPAGEGKTRLEITIPKAYIISHDAPLNDTCEVIFDIADKAEPASVGQYIALFNKKKKEMEQKIAADGMFLKAQESAKKQLEQFFHAIPEFDTMYEVTFVLAK